MLNNDVHKVPGYTKDLTLHVSATTASLGVTQYFHRHNNVNQGYSFLTFRIN